MRERVLAARGLQAGRLGSGRCNAEATVEEVRRDAALDAAARLTLAEGQATLGAERPRLRPGAAPGPDASRTWPGAKRVHRDDVAEALSLRSRAR